MADELEVPKVFGGQVPDGFAPDLLSEPETPQESRAAKFIAKLLHIQKQPTSSARESTEDIDILNEEIVRLKDLARRALYSAAIALEAERRVREDIEKEKIDERTGLLNPKYVEMHGNELLKSMGSRRSGNVAAFLIDIVEFGEDINNVHGHVHGHKVLKDFAQFLQNDVFRDDDLIGRYGGDEFLVLVPIRDPSVNPRELMREIGERLNTKMPYKSPLGPRQIRHRATIADDGEKVNDIVKRIDIKGKTKTGEDKKETAIYSHINPAYFSGGSSERQSPSEAV